MKTSCFNVGNSKCDGMNGEFRVSLLDVFWQQRRSVSALYKHTTCGYEKLQSYLAACPSSGPHIKIVTVVLQPDDFPKEYKLFCIGLRVEVDVEEDQLWL